MARDCAHPVGVSRAVEARLRDAGLRLTQDRRNVLTFLMKHAKPLSVDILATHFSHHVHKVTLYRMLEQFSHSGLVVRSLDADGKRLYEYQASHHHHITCESCGRRDPVAIPERALERHVRSQAPVFTRISRHTVEFYGVCSGCAG